MVWFLWKEPFYLQFQEGPVHRGILPTTDLQQHEESKKTTLKIISPRPISPVTENPFWL